MCVCVCVQISAVEIERVCNQVNNHIIETAAVAVPPYGGGPDELVIFAVLDNDDAKNMNLPLEFTKVLQSQLNPLFKVTKQYNDSDHTQPFNAHVIFRKCCINLNDYAAILYICKEMFFPHCLSKILYLIGKLCDHCFRTPTYSNQQSAQKRLEITCY